MVRPKFSGSQLAFILRQMDEGATAALVFDKQIGPGELHAQASYQFRDEQQTSFSQFSTTIGGGVLTKTGPRASYAEIPEFKNVGASAAYEFGNYEIGIFGNNRTNGAKETDIGRATYCKVYQAGDRVTYARPRTIGIRLKMKF